MARARRWLEANVVYHVWNRRTEKQDLFDSYDAYQDFLSLVECGKSRYPIRLHAYCLMSNHWHFAVSANDPADVSRFFRWVATTHAVRFRVRTETRGHGHVYGDRFRAKGVDGVVSYVRLVSYIEANPRAAGLVKRAEDYQWSSLRERTPGCARLIDPGPWELPTDWVELVNTTDVALELVPSLLGQVPAFTRHKQAFPEFS